MSPDNAVVLCGAYTLDGSAMSVLLDRLPRPAIIRREEHSPAQDAVIDLLAAETSQNASGQQTVLDRLLDVSLVHALRTLWSRPSATVPGWYRGLTDPRLRQLLTALHDRPEAPWQLAEMAKIASMSRANLAGTFARIVGTPPGRYLAELRMQRAEDALVRSDATLAAIARSVGYANPYAFANAFKRTHGTSPGRWRQERERPDPTAAT
jgi:AraC-like DNA-binding protein